MEIVIFDLQMKSYINLQLPEQRDSEPVAYDQKEDEHWP
jgi:hypothetical protein